MAVMIWVYGLKGRDFAHTHLPNLGLMRQSCVYVTASPPILLCRSARLFEKFHSYGLLILFPLLSIMDIYKR